MGGIEVKKYNVALHSSTGQGVEPEYMGWQPEDIEEYLKNNPMPDDPNYSKDDMISDLTDSSGTLTFSEDLKPETLEFLEVLMNWLMYDLPKKPPIPTREELTEA